MKMRTTFFILMSAALGAQTLLAVPRAPDKVEGARSANGNSFTLRWSSAAEVASYRVIRTSVLTGGTTSVSFTVSAASSPALTDSTVSGRTFFYRVRAVDAGASESPDSEAASSDASNTAYFMADDGASFASVPGTLKAALDAEGTALRGTRVPQTEGNRVYRSIRFDAVDTVTDQTRANYVLSSPASFGIAYSVGGDGIVHPNIKPAVSYPDAAGARSAFSIYWNNGEKFIKVGSSVTPAAKAAVAISRLPGSYQLQLVSQPLAAQLNGVYPRVISPNGDGVNDRVFFLFENPSQAQASGSIYDALSSRVSDLKTTDLFGGDTVLYWDGTDTAGAVVTGGYYIYKLDVGDRSFSGTVAVAR